MIVFRGKPSLVKNEIVMILLQAAYPVSHYSPTRTQV
jgi:hypothetical protein